MASSVPAPPPPPLPSMGIPPPPPPLISLSISSTVTSKPPNVPQSNTERSALLSDIAKGVKLKKCIPRESKNAQFLDGNNNNGTDPSASGYKLNDKCGGPLPSALHAELTNTLKKRKTSKIDVESTKDGIRTFDPNILNTHVPQPTGFKITHASPNFNVCKKSPPMMKKSEEETKVVVAEKPPISAKRPPFSKESSPKLNNGIDTVDRRSPEMTTINVKVLQKQLSEQILKDEPKTIIKNAEPETPIASPSINELKKQLSVSSQTDNVKKVDKKIQKLEIKIENYEKTKMPSPEVASPTIKQLKKQLSVAAQTDDTKKVEKKVTKLEIPNFGANEQTNNTPKSPVKSPNRPTVLTVTSSDAANRSATKKICHPGANFTLPRKTTTNKMAKSPVKPSSPVTKSFQKENMTFNKPTIASLQRQNSLPQKKPVNDNGIPMNFEKKSQISFSKEMSNAKNCHQETVKTTKTVITKTDLYFKDINLANVKLEINTETENVIKVVPKSNF